MYPLETTFFQIFLKGGPLMWVILLCSVIACAIAVERGVYYFSSLEDVGKLRRDLFNLLKRGDAEAALRSCDRVGSLAGQIFRAGLLRSGDGRGEIVRAMECVAQEQVQDLEKWLPALSVIANISPLLGFLGTALGLASSVYGIQFSAAPVTPVSFGHFSVGIWQSLLTTIAGLCVGVFAALVHNVYVVWINRTVSTLEYESEKFADQVVYFSETVADQDKDRELSQEP